jgi:hypothetical protein
MVALAGGLPRFDPENAHDLGIRMRLGEILGGEAGARVADESAAALCAEGIVNPARWRPGPWVSLERSGPPGHSPDLPAA